MSRSFQTMIKNLQKALNTQYDMRLLYNRHQWYSNDKDTPITSHIIKQAQWDEDRQRNQNIELFSSTSPLQIVFFLRDLLYELRGDPIPEPTPQWAEAKEKYYSKSTSINHMIKYYNQNKEGEQNNGNDKEKHNKQHSKKE